MRPSHQILGGSATDGSEDQRESTKDGKSATARHYDDQPDKRKQEQASSSSSGQDGGGESRAVDWER